MNCPHCDKDIPDETIAKHLASKGGKAKKKFSKRELKIRSDRLAEARAKRWPKKIHKTTSRSANDLSKRRP